MNIVVCPGHYTAYKGVYKNGYHEYDEVSKIVRLIEKESQETDMKIHIVEGCLLDKIKEINDIGPDFAIEVHLGNSNNTKQKGSRSFFLINDNESKKLAKNLLDSCIEILGTDDRGFRPAWYKKISPKMVKEGKAPQRWKAKMDMFVAKTPCTSAIIEPFFLSSPEDCEEFIDGRYKEIAIGIMSGLFSYHTDLETMLL